MSKSRRCFCRKASQVADAILIKLLLGRHAEATSRLSPSALTYGAAAPAACRDATRHTTQRARSPGATRAPQQTARHDAAMSMNAEVNLRAEAVLSSSSD
ncbi:hypothetical protein KOW79_018116 [Hemibagrus wyckioides]|uniref:Uncharacterized protein n=1 Tax=Hemibagrus wyckioides TaxID=337641 RepID=A0A9D3N8V5_9TELE|nr:hypothetical protein KOW79_018116 [Hemibagrus wyckioides]